MKLIGDRRMRLLSFVHQGLIICLILLGLIIIGGTIYELFFRSSSPESVPVTTSQRNGEGQTFTGIGRIRVPTSDPQPGMVILFVAFTYYPEDKAFSEELVLRVGDFRQIIENYFASFSVADLQSLDEETIKKELLHQFNTILRLGQIETLYFGDFMVVG